MINRNKFNSINSIYNEYSNDYSNINSNKKKKNNIRNMTVQNNNYLIKPDDLISLSFENFEEKKEDNYNYEKNCIMGNNCPYYKDFKEVKRKIKKLIFSINKIKELNEILYNYIGRQSNLYQNLINENKHLKEELFLISSQKKFLFLNKNKRTIKLNRNVNLKEENKEKINMKKNLNKEIRSLSSFSLKNIFDLKEDSTEFDNILNLNKKVKHNKIKVKNKENQNFINKEGILFTKPPSMKNLRNDILINNKIPKKHYDTIQDYTNQQNLNFISDKVKRSFLADNIDYEMLIKNNKVLNELISLTQSENHFISIFKNSSEDLCYKYFDLISLLINDHKEILKLGFRMKDFIQKSIILIDSMIDNNLINTLLKNICEILTCKNASLYILDTISDSLIPYYTEVSENNKKRIPKNEGIIGDCFTNNRKVRIDDDNKCILCYPLVDKKGQSFGVIEAINKFIPPFNNDDEELIKLLSYQASNILMYFSSNDDNRYLINKLNDINKYSINLMKTNSKFEFTEITEKTLLNIFNCSYSKLYFVENDKIIYYNNINKEKNEFDINMGIIGKVIKIKNIYGIQNIKNCIEYNSLVDIDSFDGVLTIPIFEFKTKNIKGVAQISYIGTFDKNNMPKDIDCKLIKKFRKCIKHWIYYHSF